MLKKRFYLANLIFKIFNLKQWVYGRFWREVTKKLIINSFFVGNLAKLYF